MYPLDIIYSKQVIVAPNLSPALVRDGLLGQLMGPNGLRDFEKRTREILGHNPWPEKVAAPGRSRFSRSSHVTRLRVDMFEFRLDIDETKLAHAASHLRW